MSRKQSTSKGWWEPLSERSIIGAKNKYETTIRWNCRIWKSNNSSLRIRNPDNNISKIRRPVSLFTSFLYYCDCFSVIVKKKSKNFGLSPGTSSLRPCKTCVTSAWLSYCRTLVQMEQVYLSISFQKNKEIIIKNAMRQCEIKIDLSMRKDEGYSNFGVGS